MGLTSLMPLLSFKSVLLSRPNDLANRLRELKPTKKEYEKVKEILLRWDYTQDMLKDWHTDYYKREPIELSELDAASTLFL